MARLRLPSRLAIGTDVRELVILAGGVLPWLPWLPCLVVAVVWFANGKPSARETPDSPIVLTLLACRFLAGIFSMVRVFTLFRELLSEIVACVALHGRIRRTTLAAHLDVSVEHLTAVLTTLDRLGGAPLLVDRTRDELISLCAMELGDRAGPAGGGELAPVAGAKVKCAHCQAVLLLGSHLPRPMATTPARDGAQPRKSSRAMISF